MAEVIHIREFLRQRARSRARVRDLESLGRAVEILKHNLRDVAQELVEAPAAEQTEILERAERLVAMIRYGLRMMGESTDGDIPAGGASS